MRVALGLFFAYILCLGLLGAAYSPHTPDPRSPFLEHLLDCKLVRSLEAPSTSASWCPTSASIYRCRDRVIAVTQAMDSEDPQICVRVQVSELTLGQGV